MLLNWSDGRLMLMLMHACATAAGVVGVCINKVGRERALLAESAVSEAPQRAAGATSSQAPPAPGLAASTCFQRKE